MAISAKPSKRFMRSDFGAVTAFIGVSLERAVLARTVIAAGKLAVPAKRGRDADHAARRRSSNPQTAQRNPGGQARSPPPIAPTIGGAARRANLSRVGMIDL